MQSCRFRASVLRGQKPDRTINISSTWNFPFFSLFFLILFLQPLSAQDTKTGQAVSALGRLEPEGGITYIAAPSTPQAIMGGIITELHVNEGDEVSKGQVLATLDTAAVMEAKVIEAEASLEMSLREVEATNSWVEEKCVRADVAQREAERRKNLLERGLAGEEEAESSQGEAEALAASCLASKTGVKSSEAKSDVAKAHLGFVKAELKRSYLYSTIDGTVLDIIAKPGEFIDIEGAIAIGNTKSMVAVAEVYETDIHRVKIGQSATISSAALGQDLSGTVHHIQLMIAKQDELGTDPAARKDARIIEVEVVLENSEPASRLTNLQVDVVIHP